MVVIVPGINTLEQHLQRLATAPEGYRPARCPDCGKAGLWWHGTYDRQADRRGRGQANLNPIAIPRFFCRHCRHTCSCLPECLSPRRWYPWSVQQQALAVLVARAVCGNALLAGGGGAVYPPDRRRHSARRLA